MVLVGFSIRFVHLGIEIKEVGKGLSVFGFEIAYYGIIISLGILAGIMMACWEAKRTGQNTDDYLDFAMFVIIASIIGARIYYVVFEWDSYKDNLLDIFNIRNGGLAIYGGIIAAVITCFIFTKVKKLSFLRMVDTACIGLVTGQIIGRWGNFFNREAFGDYTDNIFAMQIKKADVYQSNISSTIQKHIKVIDGIEYIQVHPTFLYESLWNLGVLTLLLIFKKHKKFNGEVFLWYILGYALGRMWIEGLRTDQLILPVLGLPVSQLLSVVLAITAFTIIIVKRIGIKRSKT